MNNRLGFILFLFSVFMILGIIGDLFRPQRETVGSFLLKHPEIQRQLDELARNSLPKK